MKKVLILAYDFPPYVSVGGQRPYSWYKYFKEYGFYPIVVTRQWSNKHGNHLDYIAPSDTNETIIEEPENGTIIRTPYKPNLSNRLMLKYGENKFRFLRKLVTAYYEFMQFLLFVGSKSELYQGANMYLKKQNVDFIIATGEPFVLFKYAAKLGKKYKTPWIADYRDPWSQNTIRSSNFVLKLWNRYNEKRILKTARKITTVTDFFKYQIASLIKNKEIAIISNGYDLENPLDYSNIIQTNNELNIGFAGTIYPWHPIESFFNALNIAITVKKLIIKVHFYGINDREKLEILIAEKFPNLRTFVFFYNRLSYANMMSALAKCNLLLLFNYYSFIGTKIYDYLALRRKIIFCYTDDEKANELKQKHFVLKDQNWENLNIQADLIAQTESGLLIKNEESLIDTFESLSREFEIEKRIVCNSVNVEGFSRNAQVNKLANLLINIDI